MKPVSLSTTIFSAALVCAVLFTSCSSQAPVERAASRQRAQTASENEPQVHPTRESARRSSSSTVLAASPEPAPAQETAAGDAAKGKEVFEQCAICHNVDTDEEKMGPSLKGIFKKEKLKSGKAASEENVRTVINAGGNGMPGYEEMLEKEQLNDLIAYLKTL